MERLSLRLKIDIGKRKPPSRREFLLECGKTIKTKRERSDWKQFCEWRVEGEGMMRMMEKKNWILWKKLLLFTLCRRRSSEEGWEMPHQTTLITEQLETQLQSWFLFMFNFPIWYMHQHQDGGKFFVRSPSGLVIDAQKDFVVFTTMQRSEEGGKCGAEYSATRVKREIRAEGKSIKFAIKMNVIRKREKLEEIPLNIM